MNGRMAWYMARMAVAGIVLVGLAASLGCTRESLRIAMESQQRADQVQQAVFERQHEALRVLLYRDLLRRLGDTSVAASPAQREAINDVWNERDLLEFWAVQQERARALRLVGVDAKLAGEQSIVDLLIKSTEARLDRVAQRAASQAGAALGEKVPPAGSDARDAQGREGRQ